MALQNYVTIHARLVYADLLVDRQLCPQQMLVHKGGQINNVQLNTGLRIAEMSQLQNCSVMCTKNRSYCENDNQREKKSEGGMCTKNGSYCEKVGQGRCERRSEAFVKIKKKFFFFFFLEGGGGVRVDVNGEVKLL